MQVALLNNRLALPMRAAPCGARHSRAMVRSSASNKEAELAQMQSFKDNLARKLETAATPSSTPPAAKAADGRDLPEVTLDAYWDTVAELSNGTLLVMDFYTQWCGPCKLIKPTLCDWAEELAGKVNFRKFEASKENAPVGKAVAVKSVPTFVVYKGGEEVGRVVGKQEDKLRALIMENI